MRTSLLVFAALPSLVSVAAAEPLNFAAMAPVADKVAACNALKTGEDAKVVCKPVGTAKSKDLGTATIYAVIGGAMNHYAIVLDTADGKHLMSAPLEVPASSCGAGSCVSLDKATPKVREASIGGAALVFEVALAYSHTTTEGPKGAKPVRWGQHALVLCGKNTASGTLECATRTWGSRNESCTVSFAKSGQVTSTCVTTEQLDLR